MQKKTVIVFGFISLVVITALISCQTVVVMDDADRDEFISFINDDAVVSITPDPDKILVQEASIVQDPISETNIPCTSQYNGMQRDAAWVSVTHPSLSSVNMLRLDNQGKMWVATEGHGIAVFDGEEWEAWSKESPPSFTYDVVRGVGAASITAIAVIDYEPFTGEKPVSELNHKGAILVFDDQKNEWIDINAPFDVGKNDDNMRGLAVNNQGEIFIPFMTAEMVQQNDEQAADENSPGFIGFIEELMGADNKSEPRLEIKGNLGIFANDAWEIKDMPTLPPLGINEAEMDSSGNYWLATNGAGVWMFDGQDWLTFSPRLGQLPQNNVKGIAETKEGYMWAATSAGIALLNSDGKSIVLLKEDYPISSIVPEDIAVDNENRLWILSDEQISVYNGQEWALFQPALAGPPRNWSYNIAFDKDGCGWIVVSGRAMANILRNQLNMEPGDYSHLMNIGSN